MSGGKEVSSEGPKNGLFSGMAKPRRPWEGAYFSAVSEVIRDEVPGKPGLGGELAG